MNGLTIKQAKKLDSSFDVNAEKAEVIKMWTDVDGFGYSTAKLTKLDHYGDVYQLWLDGELSEVWYAIYETGNGVHLEETHHHEG